MGIWRRIFEFDYQLEIHKPVAKHRWVPRIADLARRPTGGKLDATADRKAACSASTRSARTSRSARPPPPPYARRSGIWPAGLELDVKLPA
jgi:hypothetical protein